MKKKTNLFSSRLLPLLVTAAALMQFSMTGASAATYYWDTDSSTLGAGGGTSPSGTWSTGGSTWSTSSNGTATTSAYSTTGTDDLVFSAGITGTGAYAITLDDTQAAKSLTFDEGTATISGGGSGVISLGGTGSIWTSNGASAIIGNNTSTIVSSSTGLTKAGVGTLTLNGSAANTFTGGLNVNGGTLNLDFANLSTPTDLINSGNALSLGNSGNLLITGKNSGDTSQTLGNLTVNSGGGSILLRPNGGTSTTLNLGSIDTAASGSGLLVGKALSSGTGTVAITTTSLPTNGLTDGTGTYGPRVVFATGSTSATDYLGYDWATTITGSSPYTLSKYSGYTALTAAGANDPTANYKTTGALTLSGDLNVNTLKIENTNTALTATGRNITLQSGGILVTGGQVAVGPSITNGTLTVGNGSGAYELIVHSYHAYSKGLTIGAQIGDNGSNPVTLVKNGPGALTLTSTLNSFTGGIILNGGTLTGNSGSNSIPGIPNNNALTVNASSTLVISGGQSVTNTFSSFTINNGSYLALGTNVGTLTVSGAVTGTGGGISVGVSSTGAQTINFNSTSNTFTGLVEYKNAPGLSGQNASLNVNSFADTDTYGAGNIRFGVTASTTIAHTETFKFGGSSGSPSGSLIFNNRQIEIAGLSTYLYTPILENGTSQAFTINSDLLASGTGTRTLQFQGNGAGLSTFAGKITKGNLTSLNITKAGTGTWSLSNANNDFDGTITLNTVNTSAGTLSYASALGSNPIVFNQTTGSATLSYIGSANQTMSGAITANALTTGGVTGKITLDSSGSGAVNYSNTGSLGNGGASGAKGLVLSGTNTGNNTLAGIWENNTAGGAATLTKNGTGKWIVTGTNTYTGATTISDGTLLINGNSSGATGAVAVNGTSTLGGNGTIGGNVTVAATANLAPGAAAATAGTLSIGGNLDISAPAGDVGLLSYDLDALANPNDKIAVTGTLTIGTGTLGFTDFAFNNLGGLQNGTYTLITSGGINPGDSLNSGDLSGSIGAGGTGTLQITGNNIELVVSGLGGGPGPVDHFDISAIGSPQTVGTPITGITLTAKDISNNTATGFTGTVTFGGTGGFSGTSASFSAGVLSGVSVTPTVAGSGLTFTVNDGSGHTGSASFNVQTQYEAWAGGAAFDADANGDGVKNGLAWLLGASSPTSAVTRPTVTQSGGNLTMSFTCLNAASRGSAVLNVQHSSDLGIADAWTTVAVPETSGGPTSGVTFTITPGSPSNSVTATISSSEAAAGKLFGRLKANP